MKVSVIIPSCRRPGLLREAVASALAQTVPPYEIIIGDDSPATDEDMRARAAPSSVPRVRYFHNSPGLGQAANVHRLIQAAVGEGILLLHDDDLLEIDALADLAAPLADPDVVATFGKQRVISHDGVEDAKATWELNTSFERVQQFAGSKLDAVTSAIVQQFPNAGFLVRACAAQAVGYEQAGRYGDACDQAFGVFLALHARHRFYFVNRFTYRYRLSGESISRSKRMNNMALMGYRLILGLPPEILGCRAVEEYLREKCPVAISQAAEHGLPRVAARWYFSRYHSWSIFSPRGCHRAWKILFSFLRQALVTGDGQRGRV